MFNSKRDARRLSGPTKVILTIIVCVGTPMAGLLGAMIVEIVSALSIMLVFPKTMTFINQNAGTAPWPIYLALSSPVSIIIIHITLGKIWGWRPILIGDNALFPIASKIKKLPKLILKLTTRGIVENIADEIGEAASSAISMSEVVEEVQTDEQSIEIEVETPEIVIQRQSKPADKTKAKLQKLKELHNEGLISDEDYAEEKRNILKDI